MRRPSHAGRTVGLALLAALIALPVPAALAQGKGGSPAGSLFPGGGSKEPINIEADRLEFYDKDQRAVYIGNVVVVQGESTMKCVKLTIFLEKQAAGDKAAGAPKGGPDTVPTAGNSQVKRMVADGPVSLLSKDQVATGDRAEYDKGQNKVYMYGHVVLTQGANVTKGDKLTYDLTTGLALVESGGSTARVSGYFLPGSSPDPKGGKGKGDKAAGEAPEKGGKAAKGKPPKKPDGDG